MYTAIIADDEPWVAYGLIHLIDWEKCGFKIIDTALDGISALEKVTRIVPDLLVSDIRMPGLDGLELVRHMKDASLDTEVVFMSGYTEFKYAQEAVRLGAFDYLVKQVDETELVSMLQRVSDKLACKRASDWETYFKLFDENGILSAAECAGLFGTEGKGRQCQFITLISDLPVIKPLISHFQEGDYDMMLFRTGTYKLGILGFAHDIDGVVDISRNFVPNISTTGLSDVSDGKDALYLLYKQSDIAASVARKHSDQKTLDYANAKRILGYNSHESQVLMGQSADNKKPQTQAQQIIDELDINFTKDLRVPDLASKFYMSPNSLCTLIKSGTGATFSDYIITRRINLAKSLLRETGLSIQEIVDRTGYKDYAHFNKLFKRREGITPSKYRMNYMAIAPR